MALFRNARKLTQASAHAAEWRQPSILIRHLQDGVPRCANTRLARGLCGEGIIFFSKYFFLVGSFGTKSHTISERQSGWGRRRRFGHGGVRVWRCPRARGGPRAPRVAARVGGAPRSCRCRRARAAGVGRPGRRGGAGAGGARAGGGRQRRQQERGREPASRGAGASNKKGALPVRACLWGRPRSSVARLPRAKHAPAAPLRRRCPRRLARAQPLKRALHAPPSTSTSPGARPGAAGVQGRGRGGAGGGFPMGRRRRAERLGGEGEGSRRGGAARSTKRRSGARGGPDRSPPVGVRSRELRATSRATLRADSTHATYTLSHALSVAPSLACSLARSGRALCSAV